MTALNAAAPDADPPTPERWFEPTPQREPPYGMSPSPPPSRGYGRSVVALLFATSLIGAMLGAGGSYAALKLSGALDPATAAPGAGGPNVSIESDESTIIAAVNRVGPAVVQIEATGASGGTSGGTVDGSGIIYDAGGWILTNKHVVRGASAINVRLKDGREFNGTAYGLDTLTDLAIVKIAAPAGLAIAPIGNSATLQVGQLAIAIGSPLGIDYPDSVTTGIVSALGRDISVASDDPLSGTATALHGLIQTDAAISPGNSGGPLVDASGRVVGVTTAETQTAAGIAFAVPIDVAKPIMQQALAGEVLSRPYIGVAYWLIDKGLKAQYKLPLEQGAWVHREDGGGNSIEAVTAGSPGDVAGIKTGDIITRVEGQAINQVQPLEDVLVRYAPGRKVSIEVYRGGKYLTLMVTLGTRPTSIT